MPPMMLWLVAGISSPVRILVVYSVLKHLSRFKLNCPNYDAGYNSNALSSPKNPSCATFIPATRFAKASFRDESHLLSW